MYFSKFKTKNTLLIISFSFSETNSKHYKLY